MKKIQIWLCVLVFCSFTLSFLACAHKIDPVVPPVPALSLEESAEMIEFPGDVSTAPLTDADGTSPYYQATSYSGGFQHNITPFEIGQYEVTYELYYTVCEWANDNGYFIQNWGHEGTYGTSYTPPTAAGRLQPVTWVTWRDAVVWCNAYSEMNGLTPCYYTDSTKTSVLRTCTFTATISLSNGDLGNDCVKWDADGYRLPTEGEWQYAASCGAVHGFYTPSGADAGSEFTTGAADTDGNGEILYALDVAWFTDNCDRTQIVGMKKPNIFGLYDMSGNVSEWCWDWDADAPVTAQTDYLGPSSGTKRITRGGSATYGNHYLEIGCRWQISNPWDFSVETGFRVVRRP